MPRVLIRDIADLQREVNYIFDQLAPDLSGKMVLINPNMMMPPLVEQCSPLARPGQPPARPGRSSGGWTAS